MTNTNETPAAFETSMAKLPRTAKAIKTRSISESDCICCAKPLVDAAFAVVTEQGEYLIGSDCAKKAAKAGFEIVPA